MATVPLKTRDVYVSLLGQVEQLTGDTVYTNQQTGALIKFSDTKFASLTSQQQTKMLSTWSPTAKSIKFALGTIQSYKLVGVQKVTIDKPQDVGEQYGLTQTFLQPWYYKATRVNISGKSNIGAFAIDVLNLTADTTKQDLLTLTTTFNQLQNDPTREVLLQFGDEVFVGYIEDFNYTEDRTQPFIVDYTLAFIGKDATAAQVAQGKQAGATDLSTLRTPTNAAGINTARIFSSTSVPLIPKESLIIQ